MAHLPETSARLLSERHQWKGSKYGKGEPEPRISERCRSHKINIIVTWSSGLLCCFLLCKPGSQEEVPLSIPRITVRTEVECILTLSEPHPKYLQLEGFPKSGLFFSLETLECT